MRSSYDNTRTSPPGQRRQATASLAAAVLVAVLAPRLAHAQAAPAQSPPVDTSLPSGPALVLATGAVLLATGLVVGALALSERGTIDQLCGDVSRCPDTALTRYAFSTMNGESATADVLIIGGGLVAAGSAVWLWVATRDHSNRRITAFVTPGGFGITGRF